MSVATTLSGQTGVAPRRRGSLAPYWLIAPVALLMGVFLLLPYLNIVVMSIRTPTTGAPYGPGFTLANYIKFAADPFYWFQFFNTLLLAFVTSAICLVLAFPVAWQLARGSARWRGLCYGIVMSPLLVGIVIRSYGWTILLGNNGLINRTLRDWGLIDSSLPLMYNSTGIVIALVHVFLPFMVLPLMGAIQGIDPRVEQAGRSLGASQSTVFWRIIFPLARPGMQSGCILVFILALSAYVTPALIGANRFKTMPVSVVDALVDTFQWPFGSALALILAAAGTLVVVIFARLTRIRWT